MTPISSTACTNIQILADLLHRSLDNWHGRIRSNSAGSMPLFRKGIMPTKRSGSRILKGVHMLTKYHLSSLELPNLEKPVPMNRSLHGRMANLSRRSRRLRDAAGCLDSLAERRYYPPAGFSGGKQFAPPLMCRHLYFP